MENDILQSADIIFSHCDVGLIGLSNSVK